MTGTCDEMEGFMSYIMERNHGILLKTYIDTIYWIKIETFLTSKMKVIQGCVYVTLELEFLETHVKIPDEHERSIHDQILIDQHSLLEVVNGHHDGYLEFGPCVNVTTQWPRRFSYTFKTASQCSEKWLKSKSCMVLNKENLWFAYENISRNLIRLKESPKFCSHVYRRPVWSRDNWPAIRICGEYVWTERHNYCVECTHKASLIT